MKVWLDDERPMPPGYDLHVKSASEAIALLARGGVEVISLDHDLGEERGTGYDVACYIEQAAYSSELAQLEVLVHSANPVGRARIEQAISQAKVFWRGVIDD
jgi:hypothetical protein